MRKIYLMLLVACAATVSYAQEQIDVTVSNFKTFKPVDHIMVFLRNSAIGLSDSAVTNMQGQVSFKGLALNGAYRVYSEATPDYSADTSAAIVLRSNFIRTVSLSVSQKENNEMQEVVIKSKSTTLINTTNAEVSSEFTAKEIEELPVEGRDIEHMLYRLPNVTLATGFFSEAPSISINGGNGLFNNYLIDGMDNNEQFLGGIKFPIPAGFTQNVSVLTNNYSAEYGNTENGIINVTPKSGTNITTGEVFFLTRPSGKLDGQSDYVQRDLSGNQVKQGFQRYQAGFGLGGAIKKDKTFYYINYEHTTDIKDNILSVPELGVNETVRGTNHFDLMSAKIDQVWNSKWKSSLRGNVGIIGIERQAGGLDGGDAFPSAANTQDRNSYTVANKNIYTGRHFTSETNFEYSYFRWNYARPANSTEPDVTLLDTAGVGIAYLGNPGYAFDDHAHTEQIQQKFTITKKNHTLKFGAEVLSTGHQLYGGGDPNGSYTVKLTEAQIDAIKAKGLGSNLSPADVPNVTPSEIESFAIELHPTSFGVRQTIYSAYAEDQWKATSRLNVNIGLRYDYDNLSKGGGSGDFNNIAPRVSANFRLDNRSSIRAGITRVYDKILYTVYSDALQNDNIGADYKAELQLMKDKGILPSGTDINKVTFDGNQNVSPPNPTYLGTVNPANYADQRNQFGYERRILNPDGYKNPYNDMLSVGYQYQISNKMLFYVDFMYNHSHDLFRLYNYNAPAAYDATKHPNQALSTASADSSRPIPIYTDPSTGEQFAMINGQRLTGIAKNLVVTRDDGESKYYAMSLNLQKAKGDDFYAFRLIYTLSSLRNNTEDVNFRAMDNNNIGNDWGPSVNDRRHVINAIVNFYPVRGLTLTAAGLIQSGQPVNRLADGTALVVDSKGNAVLDANGKPQYAQDINGDGSSYGDQYVGNSDRYPGASRNSDRLPWSKVFDLSAQYTVHFGKSVNSKNGIELRVDCFNVFNTTNYSGYANNATQSNQIQIGAPGTPYTYKNAGPPRQFQFGVRYVF